MTRRYTGTIDAEPSDETIEQLLVEQIDSANVSEKLVREEMLRDVRDEWRQGEMSKKAAYLAILGVNLEGNPEFEELAERHEEKYLRLLQRERGE